MNWQCVVTRAMASSMARPSRRRWAPTSMNGIGADGVRTLWFMNSSGSLAKMAPASASSATRPLVLGRLQGRWPAFEATRRDLETRDALLAGDRGRRAVAHGVDERDQFRAQRLVMADRYVPHRIGAIRLKAEALGDLARQQVAHDVLAAGRDGDVARLEWREPIGVDVGQHARGRAELQQRDVLALRDGAGKLRLNLDDVGIGEPANQIDVVNGEIDHH